MTVQLHVQPMTGTVHLDATCSTGTARYGTVPSDLPTAELVALVEAGRVKACRTCYVAPDLEDCVACGCAIYPAGSETWITVDGRMYAVCRPTCEGEGE